MKEWMSQENNRYAMAWHNFKTGQYDYLYEFPSTDESAKQYISQSPAGQSLYDLYRESFGMSIHDAMLHVLKAMAGESEPVIKDTPE